MTPVIRDRIHRTIAKRRANINLRNSGEMKPHYQPSVTFIEPSWSLAHLLRVLAHMIYLSTRERLAWSASSGRSGHLLPHAGDGGRRPDEGVISEEY